MAALLDSGSLVGAWLIQKEINTASALQTFDAEHFHTGHQAIVVCKKRVSQVCALNSNDRLGMLAVLRKSPRGRCLPVIDCGEWEALEWVCVAKPPEHTILLSDDLIQNGPFSEKLAAALLRDLLDGLGGQAHLRLRPSVLWIDRARSLISISEDGLALLLPDAPAPIDVCVAPEQRAGMAERSADIYACGMILYQVLTGIEPFYEREHYLVHASMEALPSVRRERADLVHAEAFDRLIQLFARKRPGERPTLENARQEARALALRLRAPAPAAMPTFFLEEQCTDQDESPMDLLVPQSARRPVNKAQEKARECSTNVERLRSTEANEEGLMALQTDESMRHPPESDPDLQKAMDALKLAVMSGENSVNPERSVATRMQRARRDGVRRAMKNVSAHAPPKRSHMPALALGAMAVLSCVAIMQQIGEGSRSEQRTNGNACELPTIQSIQNSRDDIPRAENVSPSMDLRAPTETGHPRRPKKSFQMVEEYVEQRFTPR